MRLKEIVAKVGELYHHADMRCSQTYGTTGYDLWIGNWNALREVSLMLACLDEEPLTPEQEQYWYHKGIEETRAEYDEKLLKIVHPTMRHDMSGTRLTFNKKESGK
jgi:hypothetical protein